MEIVWIWLPPTTLIPLYIGRKGKYLRTNPTQLGIGDEMPPGLAHVLGELFESPADNAGSDILNCFTDDVVSAADSECL